jgi:hypothetical protein
MQNKILKGLKYILVLKCVKNVGLQDMRGPNVPNGQINIHAICLEMAEPAKC